MKLKCKASLTILIQLKIFNSFVRLDVRTDVRFLKSDINFKRDFFYQTEFKPISKR
jgi:hypothetical protein